MGYLLVKPNGEMEDIEVKDYRDIQKAIGGHFELVPSQWLMESGLKPKGMVGAFCDEDGKMKELENNLIFPNDMVVGNVLFFQYDKEGQDSPLSDYNMNEVKEWVRENHSIRNHFEEMSNRVGKAKNLYKKNNDTTVKSVRKIFTNNDNHLLCLKANKGSDLNLQLCYWNGDGWDEDATITFDVASIGESRSNYKIQGKPLPSNFVFLRNDNNNFNIISELGVIKNVVGEIRVGYGWASCCEIDMKKLAPFIEGNMPNQKDVNSYLDISNPKDIEVIQ